MNACRICLRPCDSEERYHADCLMRLFDAPTLPWLGFSLPSLMRVANEMAGKMSIS